MDELLKLGFNIDPTLTIYEASRDLMRAMRAEWHDRYTLPSLWKWYEPSRVAHGAYWFDWTTADEIEWKNNYRLWMTFLNEYKNRGGRVTTGSDSRLHLQALWLRLHPRAGIAAGSGLPSVGSDPRGHVPRRRGPA